MLLSEHIHKLNDTKCELLIQYKIWQGWLCWLAYFLLLYAVIFNEHESGVCKCLV